MADHSGSMVQTGAAASAPLMGTQLLGRNRPGPSLQPDSQGLWALGLAPQQAVWQAQLLSALGMTVVILLPQIVGRNGWFWAALGVLLQGLYLHWLWVGRWRGTRMGLLENRAGQGPPQRPQLVLNLAGRSQPWAVVNWDEVATLRLIGPANDRSLQCLLHSGEVVAQKTVQWLGRGWVDLEPAVRQWLNAAALGPEQDRRALQGQPPLIWQEHAPSAARRPPSGWRTPWRDDAGAEGGIYRPVQVTGHPLPAGYLDQQAQEPVPQLRTYLLLAAALALMPWLQPLLAPLLHALGLWLLLLLVLPMLVLVVILVQRTKNSPVWGVAGGVPLAQCREGVLLLQLSADRDAQPLAVQTEHLEQLVLRRLPRMPTGLIVLRLRGGRELQQRVHLPWSGGWREARGWLAPALQQWLGADRVQVQPDWEQW